MEGKMPDFYIGNIYLNNLAKHKLGKSDEFSEIVKVIKIKPLPVVMECLSFAWHSLYICASAPILKYNDQRK